MLLREDPAHRFRVFVVHEAVPAVGLGLFGVRGQQEVFDFAEAGEVLDELGGGHFEGNASDEDFGHFFRQFSGLDPFLDRARPSDEQLVSRPCACRRRTQC